MMNIIEENLIPIIATFLTGVLSYVGIKIKSIYEKYVATKTKKEIVCLTVDYVEQVYKNSLITSEEKYTKCKEKAIEWLNKENLKVSDTELEILIESAVNHLKGGNKC